jgi:hypothetical protein
MQLVTSFPKDAADGRVVASVLQKMLRATFGGYYAS